MNRRNFVQAAFACLVAPIAALAAKKPDVEPEKPHDWDNLDKFVAKLKKPLQEGVLSGDLNGNIFEEVKIPVEFKLPMLKRDYNPSVMIQETA